MSSTPEFSRSVKFSPYGKPISKSLLTPCRTLGLSRKRKTPSSITKTPVNISRTTLNECGSGPVTPVSNNIPTTPLSHNTSVNDNTPVTSIDNNTPVSKSEAKENSGNQVNKRPKRDVKGRKDRTAKKCLDQNFKNICQEENNIQEVQTVANDDASKENILTPVNPITEDTMKIQVNSESSIKTKKNLRNVKVSLEKLSDEDIESYKNLKVSQEKDSSDEGSTEIIRVRKRRAVISSDEEDDNFEGFSMKKSKEYNKSDELGKENLLEENGKIENNIEKNTISEDRLSGKSVCESGTTDINIEKPNAIADTESLPSSDTEKLSGISTKSDAKSNSNKGTLIISDDDFVSVSDNKKRLTLTRTESSDKKQKSKDDKKKSTTLKTTNSNEKDSKPLKQMNSLTSIIDDEEDAFTSTPEREKNEKIVLIEKLKNLEREVKVKRKKVEDLKQAQIYKTKHNIDELKNLTDVWRAGCVRGLNELLSKLQMHGPMNMLTLVNNLNIPNHIVDKCLKLNLKEEKKNQDVKNETEDFEVSAN